MKQPQVPVKTLVALAVVMALLCIGGYLLSPKWQAARAEYLRQRDPLHQFASQQTPETQLQALQDKIRANPQNSEQWALLGEYYLWQNDYSNSLLAYRQALQLRGENAELYGAGDGALLPGQPAYDRPGSCDDRQSSGAGRKRNHRPDAAGF